VQTYAPYVDDFLDEIGVTMLDVLYYFLESDERVIKAVSKGCRDRIELCKEDLNRSSPRWVKLFSKIPTPSTETLRKTALACTAFSDALPYFTQHCRGLTLWHVARKSQAARFAQDEATSDAEPFDHACEVCNT
jgi:hypothetical protein